MVHCHWMYLVNIKTVGIFEMLCIYCGGTGDSVLMNKRCQIPGLAPSELVSVSPL